MEHHLGFWPIPLLRGRNRRSRRGCRWNLTGIIALGRTAKASIFESCWIGRRKPERGTRAPEWSKQAGGAEIVRLQRTWIHLIGSRKPNRISREPCIIRAEHQARSSFKERNNGYHDNSKC